MPAEQRKSTPMSTKKTTIILFAITAFQLFATAQSITGIWEYEVLNTLSGDYFGQLIIEKNQGAYVGEIISRSDSYLVDFNYADEDSIAAFSDVEGFFATINGKFVGNQFNGSVMVLGDPNRYDFLAKRKLRDQILKIVDAQSNQAISYANVVHGKEGTITNENGLCKVQVAAQKSRVIVSAIGYQTDTVEVSGGGEIEMVQLTPTNYALPLVEVKAKGFSAQQIAAAAINKLKDNYIQQPYDANLFYRYSSFSKDDSLRYQSESILKYFDAKGYQKRRWKKTASSRYAKLEQGRITVGKLKTDLALSELEKIFVFWAHEPIVTEDKAIAKRSLDAYDYKLVGVKNFMGKEVYEIEFNCTNLKSRYTGLPSLKYMKGKIFINKEDYAIIRYEQQYLHEYAFDSKHTKRRGHLKEQSSTESSRIELFAKNEDGYYLDYAKVVNHNTKTNTLLNGKTAVFRGKSIEEYQYFNVTTSGVKPLKNNLLKLDRKVAFDEQYWKQFNIILNDNQTSF